MLNENDIQIIPHGNVLDFKNPLWNQNKIKNNKAIFSMHGGFRPNKNYSNVIVNFAFGLPIETNLKFLTRGISEIEMQNSLDIENTIKLAKSIKNFDLRFSPDLTDTQIAKFTDKSDILVMPYKWGSHSGQLELAFDLGLKSVITNVGFYREQYQNCANFALEPEWVDWSDGILYQYGSRLLNGLLNAYNRKDSFISRNHIKDFRILERKKILDMYYEVYYKSIFQ